ncbi:hypothetical protein PBY51_003398 [Eleginops maclovinus]|uniref:Chemokine interleukin-8-like domain-containing protein n=1 Tax=Eleginops maclovinus TaxID=56733 RepID=A0AAN7Y175_ELEMC|nr:hypothetical protein PBY51_003398 [Eleginops maclovinus]
MHPALTALLCCLLVLSAQGHPANKSNKCKCLKFVNRVNPQQIQGQPAIHEPSAFCQHREIIIWISNVEYCINPQSKLGKLILTNRSRHGKK